MHKLLEGKKLTLLIISIIIIVVIILIIKNNNIFNIDLSNQFNKETKITTDNTNNTTDNDQLLGLLSDKLITKGETVNNTLFTFTLNSVELDYSVEPDNKPPYGYNYYPADSGHVYIHIDANVKNNTKNGIICDKIYGVTANYDNGYKYTGFPIVEDQTLGFTYASITELAPLQTIGIHYLIDCPNEVYTNLDKPLSILIQFVDGSSYKYILRE